ncbi:hypothetical protein IAG44_40170 [Streptomyces roseirectus]|uniref:Secreted protein n=1 Tax=Streptomyces roseirectus TaxID=2768066 RepID=A0A7H0IQF7_9ACTN|nr:hypothetical protein [Streptomyces roseirectus]QNP75023.1 hypothetical protein IAG44_40170 [Streptomyces roseirectus]
MRTRLIASWLSAGAALAALLAPTTATAAPATTVPATQAGPYCIPEARVCAGLDGNATQGYQYVFTIHQPPSSLTFRFTVNGLPATGGYRVVTQPTYVQGWFFPSPPLVRGDEICMTLSGIIPSTYCSTVP